MTASQHAILRFAQRVLGVQMQTVPEALNPDQAARVIVPPRLWPVIQRLGDGEYGIRNGDRYRVVVKRMVIITVLPPRPLGGSP